MNFPEDLTHSYTHTQEANVSLKGLLCNTISCHLPMIQKRINLKCFLSLQKVYVLECNSLTVFFCSSCVSLHLQGFYFNTKNVVFTDPKVINHSLNQGCTHSYSSLSGIQILTKPSEKTPLV